jgi:signal transduction histidine kinase
MPPDKSGSVLPDPFERFGALRPRLRDVPRSRSVKLAALISECTRRLAINPGRLPQLELTSILQPLLERAQLDVFCLVRMPAGASPEIVCHVEPDGSALPTQAARANQWLPWLAEKFAENPKQLLIRSVAELSPSVRAAWRSLSGGRLRSLLLVPALMSQGVRYVGVFGSSDEHAAGTDGDVRHLKKLVEGVALALGRRDSDEATDRARKFEQLMSRLLRGFGAAHWTQIDAQIDRALEDIRNFLDADQCALLTIGPGDGEATIANLASRDIDFPLGVPVNYSVAVPWIFGRLVNRRETIAFSRPEDLPSDAAIDRRYLQSVRTHAAVYVPYTMDGLARFIFSVVVNDRARSWSPSVIEQLEVVGAAFLSPIRRKTTGAAAAQAQKQLVSAQQFSQATLDALHKYVAVIDVTGQLVRTSDLWGSIGGETPCVLDAVKGGGNLLAALEALQGPLRERALRLSEGVRSVLSGDVPCFDTELNLQPSQAPRWLHVRVQQFVVHGSVFAAVSYEDVTQRHQREQELQLLRDHQWHSDRVAQTGVLIASLAHELSQPMAAILINAQTGLRLLADNKLVPQLNREILSDMVADCKRAGAVIESLRIMLRRRKTEQKPEDVAEIVSRMVRLLHSETVDQRVEIAERYQDGCIVTADRGQIQQVALNLIVNAIEAMADVPAPNRHLRVSVARWKDDRVLLSVRDSGVGITQEQMDKVFEAFWTTKAHGTGMGLPICQAIVETHGGTIWIKRQKVGATFYVALPLSRPQPLTKQLQSRGPGGKAA